MSSGGSKYAALAKIREVLDGRRLVWFGIRGEDGESLLQLEELQASCSVTAALRSGSLAQADNVTLESISGRRPDLDRHDIDLDTSESAADFRRRLLRQVSGRCVVMTYRPAAFVSALAFSMADTMELAGPFKDRQSAFEHKPWVETSLARRGVRTLGWRYVHDEERGRVRRLLDAGPMVLRANRSSGGVGIVRIDSADEIDAEWPYDPDGFVAVAPFLDGAVPLNVSACLFPDGALRVHPPSLQLVGIEGCTDRPFGYCGNDFGAISALDNSELEQFDSLVRDVGGWLYDQRYVGAFGIDALLHDGLVYFTEVNARFQGSSALSAVIAEKLDVPDLFLDHLAATLMLPALAEGMSLMTWAKEQPPVAHVVVHNTDSIPMRWTGSRDPRRTAAAVRPAQVPFDVVVEPGGVLFRLLSERGITETGFEIDTATCDLVGAMRAGCVPEHEDAHVSL